MKSEQAETRGSNSRPPQRLLGASSKAGTMMSGRWSGADRLPSLGVPSVFALLSALMLALAGCLEPAPGPGRDTGSGSRTGGDTAESGPTVDGGAPARIDPSVLAGTDEDDAEPGAGTALPTMSGDDPIAAATELALSTVEVPEEILAQQREMARSGEAAKLESTDINGLALFLADASRLDQQTVLGVGPLRSEIEADPGLIDDPEWLAKALRAVEAAGRIGRTIETGLDGPTWPEDMRILVEQTIRGQIVVPLVAGSGEFKAAVQTANPEVATQALETLGIGVSGLVAALEQMPVLMLAAERATQTAEPAAP